MWNTFVRNVVLGREWLAADKFQVLKRGKKLYSKYSDIVCGYSFLVDFIHQRNVYK